MKTSNWSAFQQSTAQDAMHKILCDANASAPRLRNRPGFTALAVLMLSLGVGATTALFTLVDRVSSTPSFHCETMMERSGAPSTLVIAHVPNRAELRARVADAYETSVESAGDAFDAIPDVGDVTDSLSERPVLALLGIFALGFLLMCARGASGMIATASAPLVAIGATVGALVLATLSLRALDLPAIGLRGTAFALCVSLVAVAYARGARRKAQPLTI